MEQKQFNFTMTFDEARLAIMGLKKFPMEQVEAIITKLDKQYQSQTEKETAENPTVPVTDIVEDAKVKRSRKTA